MNWRCLAAFLAVALAIAFASVVGAQSASPEDTLRQYVADLQKNPNDHALREKIIRHVQTMKPAPAIPEKARRHYVKGSTLIDEAKNPSDSADAAEEFRQSLLIAPWWGDAYMKLGLALESAQHFDDAIASLRLFLATNPRDDVSRKAQDEIYKIEARAQKVAKQRKHSAAEVSQTSVEPKQDPFEALLRKIDGRRYILSAPGGKGIIDIKGNSFVTGSIPATESRYYPGARYEIRGRESRHTVPDDIRSIYSGTKPVETLYKISEDGDYIIVGTRWSDGDLREAVYRWQR